MIDQDAGTLSCLLKRLNWLGTRLQVPIPEPLSMDLPLTVSERPLGKLTVFQHVLSNKTGSAKHALSPLGELNSLQSIFPTDQQTDFSSIQEMKKDLQTVAEAWDTVDTPTKISFVLWLLQKYGWCVEEPGDSSPKDISLFIAPKIEAAREACKARPHNENNPYVLAVGDISGIQNYIFDIASTGVGGGVAKRLRARSLYVQLLSETAALQCLRAVENPLPICNVIMSSGGKFYVLLPNAPNIGERLRAIQTEIDNWLLKELNGEIAINLAWVEFDEKGFGAGSGGFGSILSRANMQRLVRKNQLFRDLLIGNDGWNEDEFVRDVRFEGESICRSCHKQPRTDGDICGNCARDASIGGKLPSCKYICYYDKPGKGDLPVLGWSVSLTTEPPKDRPYYQKQINSFNCSRLPNCMFSCTFLPKHLPRKNNREVMTFEEIALIEPGKPYLAHLKADVDHMGYMFALGLKRDHPDESLDTMARTAEMSFALDLFFSGWLSSLLEFDFANCYSVFAGGDDLYIIGPRSQIVTLAERLADDFARYVCNDRITLSAGIVFKKPNTPIAMVAEDAEHALEQAKSGGRNSLTIFDHVLNWTRARAMLKDYESLHGTLISKECPSSLLHRLRYYSSLARKTDEDVLAWKYKALLAYDTRRNIDENNELIYSWFSSLSAVHKERTVWNSGIEEADIIAQLSLYERGDRNNG